MIEWLVDRPGLRLGLGNSVDYDGDADLVFSHLYGPLPKQLIGKPAIINVFGNKKAKAEEWCGAELFEYGRWGRGVTNTIFIANMSLEATQCYWQASPPSIADLQEDEIEPGYGWFPDELPRRLLKAWAGGLLPVTVFDGFMGRATVGKIARSLNLGFVGIDIFPARVVVARDYLGC